MLYFVKYEKTFGDGSIIPNHFTKLKLEYYKYIGDAISGQCF